MNKFIPLMFHTVNTLANPLISFCKHIHDLPLWEKSRKYAAHSKILHPKILSHAFLMKKNVVLNHNTIISSNIIKINSIPSL